MKLNSFIARLIRCCGYTAAFTVAAGNLLSAAQETTIRYLSHGNISTNHITQASQYKFNLDLSKPNLSGITPWGTGAGSNNIVDHVLSGNGAIKGWCPWRHKDGGSPGHDYEVFIPNLKTGNAYTQATTNNSVTWISNAIRPTIQNALQGVDSNGKKVEEISYLGARSLLPAWEDSYAFSYYAEDDVNQPLFNKDGVMQTKIAFRPVYGANGEQLCDEQGRKLVTARNTVQYYKQVVNAETGDVSYEAIPAHLEEIRSACVGDTTLAQGRAEIAATKTPVDVHNNKLIINQANFSLAVGAYSQYGDVYKNLTYIHDVRVSDDIIGAATYRGSAHDNNTVVARAQAIGQNTTLSDEASGVSSSNYNNSGKVIGVWSASIETNDAWNNNTFIYGSTIYQDASAAWTGGSVWNNTLFINLSEIATGLQDVDAVMGGYSTRTGISRKNLVIIDDTFNAIAAGIPKEDVSANQASAGGKTGSVPDVTTIHTDVYGGRTSRGYGDNGAHDNKVIIKGITTRSTSGTTKGQTVTTSVEGNVFGGVASNNSHDGSDVDFTLPAASATGNIVSITDAHIKESAWVPFLQGRKPEIWGMRKLRVGEGKIIGGYVGAPKDNRAPGKANENKVYLTNTTIENSVYGGVNLGAGEASKNQLHLHKVKTGGKDLSIYGGWLEAYDSGGRTNNNNVYLYKKGWSMDNTFLHGGWGNEVAGNSAGILLGANGTPFIKGATSFDGTSFFDKNGTLLATLNIGTVTRPATSDNAFSTTWHFDGTHFFDEDLYQIGALEKLAIKDSGSTDLMRGVERIKVNKDANGKVTSVDFLADGNDAPIATYTAATGKIVGAAGVDIISQTVTFDEATGVFTDSEGKAQVTIVKGAIVNRDGNIRAHGVVSQKYDEATGELSFLDKDGNVLAVYKSSSITGTDGEGNAINITLKNTKDGNTLSKGNVLDLLARISGYNEYLTYTKGNWLHIAGFQGKIKGFDHFEKLHFVVSKDINRKKPMITLTGPASSTGLTYINEKGQTAPIKVTADISPVAHKLKVGDIIPLFGQQAHERIKGTNLIPKDSVVDDTKRYRAGVTRTFTLDTIFKEMKNGPYKYFGVIEVIGRQDKSTPEAKSLLEGRIAMLTLNNMGGDLAAGQGIDSATRALEGNDPGAESTYIAVDQSGKGSPEYVRKDELDPGHRLFFAMSGSHTLVDSGSDVDVDGTNALVGISRGFLEKRPLVLGAFMETGWGKYHTSNHFGTGAHVPHVRGTGESSYVGAGALLRYKLQHINRSLAGFSLDATLRAGSQELDYSTPDLKDDYGALAKYDISSTYVAGHVGLNYTVQPTDKLAATFYARYLWTRIDEDNALVCKERVYFEDGDSNRVHLGSRLSWQVNDHWQPYLGAAFEWEFSGTARANTYGMGITSPSMRGGSVIGEIGAVWQPSLNHALWLEGALQGSVGKRENYGGRIGVSLGF